MGKKWPFWLFLNLFCNKFSPASEISSQELIKSTPVFFIVNLIFSSLKMYTCWKKHFCWVVSHFYLISCFSPTDKRKGIFKTMASYGLSILPHSLRNEICMKNESYFLISSFFAIFTAITTVFHPQYFPVRIDNAAWNMSRVEARAERNAQASMLCSFFGEIVSWHKRACCKLFKLCAFVFALW